MWTGLVDNVVKASGGQAAETHQTDDELSDDEAEKINEWATALRDRLVAQRPSS
jgi:hypothetical protein